MPARKREKKLGKEREMREEPQNITERFVTEITFIEYLVNPKTLDWLVGLADFTARLSEFWKH